METLFEHPVAFIRIDIYCFAAIKISKATLANYLACRDGFVYFIRPRMQAMSILIKATGCEFSRYMRNKRKTVGTA